MKIKFNYKVKGLQDQTPKRGNRTFDQMAQSDDWYLLSVKQIESLQRQLAKARTAKKHKTHQSDKQDEDNKKIPQYKEDWKSRLQGIA